MRVLIADDDAIAAKILRHALERWGLEVIVAPDGERAWQIVQADDTIGLAIFDWMMPGADGPTLCRRIRQWEARAHLYVILLTARTQRTDIVAGIDAGADDYLIKPFDPEELRARVHVGIRIVSLQRRLRERVTELQDALSKVKQLSGMLPICSYCKRVRSDENYWEQVDSYVAQHSEAQFSHGICPHCIDAVRVEFEREPGNH